MTTDQPRRTQVTAMSDKTFDFLRGIAQIWLPAIGAFYFTIATIWHLPASEEVVGTIVALDTLLGIGLGYSRKKYLDSEAIYDGTLEITQRPADRPDLYSLDLSTPLQDVPGKTVVTLKVHNNGVDPEDAGEELSQN